MSDRQAASGAAQEQQSAPDRAPVGVFDSGVGGLTILRDLLRELPAERYVYFGDTGNCPYGVRTEPEIQALAISAMRLLLDRGAKIVVVACNTASVSALAALRATYPDTPFVGVVPAVKPAAARTRTGRVGIAATEASARGDYLKRLVAEHANGVEVLAVGCPRLVTLAEAGVLEGPEAEAAVRDYIAPMLAAGIDELVLGCTHFPAMRAVFERVAGPGVEVIDSGEAIARRARFILAERGRLADPAGGPADQPRAPDARDEFWCSGDVAQFARVATAILASPVTARFAPGMPVVSAEA
jgi:glutamate racemase